MIRVLKIIVILFRNKECTVTNIVRNIYFNTCRKIHAKGAFLVCGKQTDLKIDKDGSLSLTANLFVGKRELDKTHYKSWIWIMEGGRINVSGQFILYEGDYYHWREAI